MLSVLLCVNTCVLMLSVLLFVCTECITMYTEVLPLVEFHLEPDISDEEAVNLLDTGLPLKKEERSWKETKSSSEYCSRFL